MTKTTAETTADDRRGGLPEDSALAAAFSAAVPRRRGRKTSDQDAAPSADDASPASAEATPAEAEPDAEEPQAEIPQQAEPGDAPQPAEEPAAATETAPAPAREPAVTTAPGPVVELRVQQEPPLQHDARSTQCTVNVSVNVRDRFSAYQLAKKVETGAEPTNAVVVRRAVLYARKHDLFAQMLEAVRHRKAPLEEDDDDPEGLFGDVPGRRVERGRARDMAQQSFRPSYRELAVIDAMATGYGFDNRSEFLDAALDAFLPKLEKRRR